MALCPIADRKTTTAYNNYNSKVCHLYTNKLFSFLTELTIFCIYHGYTVWACTPAQAELVLNRKYDSTCSHKSSQNVIHKSLYIDAIAISKQMYPKSNIQIVPFLINNTALFSFFLNENACTKQKCSYSNTFISASHARRRLGTIRRASTQSTAQCIFHFNHLSKGQV